VSLAALAGARVVLGVSGGVAAYKAVDLCRRMVDAGAHVSVILTEDAHRFIGPVTFSALSSEPVHTSLWDDASPIPHTRLGQTADVIVVAPATSRVLSACRTGYSHDLLSATLIATRAPVVLCPAMHTEMWENAAVRDNVDELRRRGAVIVEPENGRLAGGDSGAGRLATPESILDAVARALKSGRDLSGVSMLVSAGGTREPIDAVRVLANRSSGRQGHAIAEAASARGAAVTLVTTTDIPVPPGIVRVAVETAAQMSSEMVRVASGSDVVIMTAAVADFRPETVVPGKWKKSEGAPQIRLVPTEDILARLGETKRPGQVLVGFAAETSDLVVHARDKLVRKNLDLVVANDVSAPGVGFGHETNAVTILSASGEAREVGLSSKRDIAAAILDSVCRALADIRRD
jgi:phosphopantothenoylcysteine decarboxylase/phosphopantothenate--cysteine ligase